MLKKLKFCIAAIFAVCLFSAGNTALAAPICPVPTEVTQPDGTVITVTAYGDEFFSWKEDENGNVIAYDEATDSYKYAEIEDGKLVPTSEMVGDTSLLRSAPKRLQREDMIPLWENAERIDYSRPDETSGIALMTADEEPEQEKPLTHQKLLTLLIEFSDIKLKYDGAFWAKQMYSTNPKDISVVNYWKENSNGLDVFEPADTANVQDRATGTASYGNYTDIGYAITKCPEGVVKVSLDMPHPTKTWNDQSRKAAYDTVVLALRAVEPYFDFTKEQPNLINIFAGYDRTVGGDDKNGQMQAFTSTGIETSDGILLGRFTTQGELLAYDDIPTGIGVTCHELGHAAFNLPDLYFYDRPNGGYAANGLALYSLMSLGHWGHLYYNWGNPSELNTWNDPYAYDWCHVPTHLDPWCKIQCGFVTPTIVNEWDGNLNSISEVGADGKGIDSQYNVLEIRSKTAANQYFLVENRQLVGYDCGLEKMDDNFQGKENFSGGIVIYHVDEGTNRNCNNGNAYHRFISAERSDNSTALDLSAADWVYINRDGRNKFGPDTEPNSNLHQLKVGANWSCSEWSDCHPQTLKSGISIEILGENGPCVRVKANVDEEYRVSMVEGATFIDLFPDANFRRAVLDVMKKEDGLVRKSENVLTIRDWAVLVSIDSMDISGYGIKDLTGIEYFTILHRLGCTDNEITEITSEQISDLDSLVCDNNKLTKLDLSQWVNLEFLYCNNNLLTELDTSSNVHLWDVRCSNNHLTELDFSNSPELTSLYCQNNELTSLNVSNSAPLYDLVCSNNLLTSLDTSHNPELTYLECANNKLTGLDLTGNPILEWLWCYGNFMDTETPGNSILGLEQLEVLSEPQTNEVLEDNTFAYYPQNVPDTEHNWDSAWQKDDTHHWHNCADADCPIANNADKDGYGAHSPSEWEIVTSATTKQEGLRVKKCTVCQTELQRETIPKLKPASPSPVEPDPPDNDPANCSKDENCPLQRYTDISIAAWYHNGIHYCIENGLMNGEGNGKFAPNAVLTRGMLAQILYNNAGRPAVTGNNPFDDVASGVWYANAVTWAAESGIVSGYGNSRFGPNDPITREQLAVMLWRYVGSPATSGTLDGFTDAGKTSDYAVTALQWAMENRIISGKGNGILDPTSNATRAEVAVMLQRYLTLEG